jgi:hypothetical protein
VRHPPRPRLDERRPPQTRLDEARRGAMTDSLAGSGGAYGLPERSGGHTWTEGIHGRVCSYCGRRWAEVVGATADALGERDWAHTDILAGYEQQQFAKEVDWLWSTIVDAASSGR